MNESQYLGQNTTNPVIGTNNQGQNNGIGRFLLGLATGFGVGGPIVAFITKKICDKKREREIQKAYSQGTDDGMAIMASIAKETFQKIIENEPKTVEKTPENVSESEKTHSFLCKDPFFNGIPEEKLIKLVDEELLKDGYSEDTCNKMKNSYIALHKNGANSSNFTSEESILGITYQNYLYSKADFLRMEAMKEKIAQAQQEITTNLSNRDAQITQSSEKETNPQTQQPFFVQNQVEKDYLDAKEVHFDQLTSKKSAVNPYFIGKIEDPELATAFEAKMAESMYPTEEDINDYDLRIDDEEATQEARQFSESRVQYLEMIRQYKNVNGDIPPMTISEEQFQNEHYLEKEYINWYDGDDVFEENDSKIEDPYYNFGFVSGKDMFSPSRVANREDPDICHVRNLKLSTDFEITRVHGSYSQMIEDGEVYYHGEANP